MRAALLVALVAISVLATASLAASAGTVDLEAVSITAPGKLTAGTPVQLTATMNEKLGGSTATIPDYTVKFEYRKAGGIFSIIGRIVQPIGYPTGWQVAGEEETKVSSEAGLRITDVSYSGNTIQITVLNTGSSKATFTNGDISIGVPNLCVSHQGNCIDNPELLTKKCTEMARGSCVLKNPWGVTCTCNILPSSQSKTYSLDPGKSTTISISNVPLPGGQQQLLAALEVPGKEPNTFMITRSSDGWNTIGSYAAATHTISRTTQRKATITWTPPAAGAWEVRATIDSSNIVKESNERNNLQTKRFEVQALKPASVPIPGAKGGVVASDFGKEFFIATGDSKKIESWTVKVNSIITNNTSTYASLDITLAGTIKSILLEAGPRSGTISKQNTNADVTIGSSTINVAVAKITTGTGEGATVVLSNERILKIVPGTGQGTGGTGTGETGGLGGGGLGPGLGAGGGGGLGGEHGGLP